MTSHNRTQPWRVIPSLCTVSLACAIAPTAYAQAPEGYVLVADSQLDFSSMQGAAGWWYEFDRGAGTARESMLWVPARAP